jgi:aminoglycoside/choline kinase family phosphotransferase
MVNRFGRGCALNHLTEFPWEPLNRCIVGALGHRGRFGCQTMPGGASTRQFVRVTFEAGPSAVAMFFPEAMCSDELAKPLELGSRWPFLQVHDLLSDRRVAVPCVLAQDSEHGLLIVEDLGDDTLGRYLERNPQARLALYQLAVRDLARAQAALENLPNDCIVSLRSFDYDLLRWEIEHFREWALEAQGIQLSVAEAALFNEAASHIAHQAANWNGGFVHRDYQSRNLMVRHSDAAGLELVWIDFQDALLGPRVYDLVALLNDSYQAFTSEFIDARLHEYLSQRLLPVADFAQLRFEFDWVTVQRKLKDAGRFVYIDRIKGNSSFLQFVVPTISKVRLALSNLRADPLLSRLDDCLSNWFEKIVSLQLRE